MYGSKVLAVRNGGVLLVGQPKRPTFTILAATASPGDTSVAVAGPLNWAVGGWQRGRRDGVRMHAPADACALPLPPPKPPRALLVQCMLSCLEGLTQHQLAASPG